MKKFIVHSIFLLTIIGYLLPINAYAAVDISKEYAFGDLKTLGEGIDRLVVPAFSIAAVGVAIYFLFGGFKYLTSAGDKEAVAGAQQMIVHAIIGFVLLMFLFLVVEFVFGRLFENNIQFIKGL